MLTLFAELSEGEGRGLARPLILAGSEYEELHTLETRHHLLVILEGISQQMVGCSATLPLTVNFWLRSTHVRQLLCRHSVPNCCTWGGG